MLKNPISACVASGNIDGFINYIKTEGNIKFIVQRDSLLHVACKYGHSKIVIELLKLGADCGFKHPSNQRIPLHDACTIGNSEIVELIASNSMEFINSADINGLTSAHVCTMEGEIDCLKILKNHDADFTVKDKNGMNLIHWAAKRNHDKIIKYLFDLKMDLNEQCISGKTALHYAAISNSVAAIQMLVKCHANIMLCDNDESTSLHMAAKYNSLESLRLLISAGIPINVKQRLGRTPAHIASYQGYHECLHWLLDNGTDILSVDDDENTIGHYACRGGHGETIHCYLNHNGSTDLTNKLGEDLHQTARRYGHPIKFEKAKKSEIVCSICQLEINKRKWDQIHASPSVIKSINQSQKVLFKNPLGSYTSVINDYKKSYEDRRSEIDRKNVETMNIGKSSSQKVKKSSIPSRIDEGNYRDLINRYYGGLIHLRLLLLLLLGFVHHQHVLQV